MNYNFDEIIQRTNTNCEKWDIKGKDVLPLWVADMDFKAPQPVIDALKSRAEHGIYGYSLTTEEYFAAVCNWWNRRHGWKLEKEWIVFCPGIVPALSMLVKALTDPDDKVVIQTPVYYPFFRSVKNNGRELVENPLILKDNKYFMDFEDLELKLSDEKVKLMILCTPHNPVGRVWSVEELRRVGDMCLKYGVIVVADEIHCDLVYEGHKHVPYSTLGEEFIMNSVTCTAPSKTFNIAGLQASNLIIPNEGLRKKFKKVMEINELGEPNAFAVDAVIAAYNNGEEWLEQLLVYLKKNIDFTKKYIQKNIPILNVINTEGTYLVWVDCRKLGVSSKELHKRFLKEGQVWFSPGDMFGETGDGFVRINVACPRKLLEDALLRMKNVIQSIVTYNKTIKLYDKYNQATVDDLK